MVHMVDPLHWRDDFGDGWINSYYDKWFKLESLGIIIDCEFEDFTLIIHQIFLSTQ